MALNAYRTALGQTLRFASLPPNQVCIIQEILVEKRKHEPPASDSPRPDSFLAAARKWIKADYPHENDFLRVLRGPIGEVYRDCYYRLLAEEASGGNAAARSRFFENLRANPARVLYDRYLEGRQTQAELARAANLSATTVSRLFSLVRDPQSNEDPSISLERYQEACARLSLTLVGTHFQARDHAFEENPIVQTIDEFTVRERQLLRLVAAVTRYLFSHPAASQESTEVPQERKDACLAFLALHLGIQYGIDHIDILDRFSRAFLEEIEKARDLRGEAFPFLSEESLGQEQPSLEHLLVAFQLGVNADQSHVLLSNAKLANLLEHPRMETQQEAPPQLDPALAAYAQEVREGWRAYLKVFESWYELRFERERRKRQERKQELDREGRNAEEEGNLEQLTSAWGKVTPIRPRFQGSDSSEREGGRVVEFFPPARRAVSG